MIVSITICFANLNPIFAEEDEIGDITVEDDVITQQEQLLYLEEALSDTTTYSSNIDVYHSYLVSYFDNLTYNFGVNYKGSCGYVAIGMMLSYYDTFIDDSIIPEQYDIASVGYDNNMMQRRNSPGTLKDLVYDQNNIYDNTYGYRMGNEDYYSKIATLSNVSLHAKLITIGASRGYFAFNSGSPAGTNFKKRYNIINDYFQNVLDYDSNDYTLETINREINPNKSNEVRNFTINKVKNGEPVLLSIGKTGGDGHVVVAYDYDELTGQLYCHFGWGANKTHITIESEGYSIYKTALTMNFQTSHSHSNNYGVTAISNNVPSTRYYCYDSPVITLVMHDFTYNYVSTTGSCHLAYCECGESISVSHTYDHHYCIYCNHYTSMHDYDRNYVWQSSTMHKVECICGALTTEGHAVSNSSYSNSTRYSICLLCGGRAETGFIQYSHNSTEINKVTVNGSFILPNGVIVLVDDDIDAYLAGTLVFYDKNNSVN